jgi:GDP-4-dehydro-6-deoxy-D-mannose reductase
MRVLITGVTGFAGRHLATHCANQSGVVVMGLGRRAGSDANPPEEIEAYESVDLADAGQAHDVIRRMAPDRIFHLAGDASVAHSWDDPASVITNNICSTLNLLEAIRLGSAGTRALIAGSGEEYGDPERLPVAEDHPLRPKNPYAVSKAAIDLAAGFYADAQGLHVLRTRAFNHAGPRQSDTYVVSNLARQIAEAEASPDAPSQVEVAIGNANVRRDFTDVRDVVRAYWLALESAPPGVYNVCSGESVAIAEILEALTARTQLEVTTRTDPKRFRQREVNEIQGSHDKLTNATGWRPEIPLDQTVQDMLEWWRAQTRARVTT